MSEPRDKPSARGNVVEETILGGAARYTKGQVAEAAGVPVQRAEKLWQAMGFAHVADDAVVFTDADIAALRSLVELVSAEVIPPELESAVARSLAQTMSRLAEWQVEIFDQLLGGEFAVDVETTAQIASVILPVMEQMQGYVWRRHLAATASREMTERDAGADERLQVIGFADLVGYTRLIRDFSEQAGELEELIDGFESLAWGVVAENHGRVIKTIGDEVLFVTDTAADAAEIALTLNEKVAENGLLPPLRIGMAEGPVLARFGDVYGSTVNAASRLTSVARPASALVDRELALSLRKNPAYRLISVGPQKVQGFRGLHAWALRRAG
ncbi:adenylate/guanylate cyclase domain-containing protein [Saccharopolyspora indica]|uniref:adenylate/guanylate cyclase domain-containing protein n=1 Tax=Saccharopolyspora indica TaxID=1229659 RepID=UPI0022EB8594|nr:adenylate/guanylate cyclase domain-containing protein [Saccharopolyspora indica]MDA3646903.1 adenylate/guanylate cyclase domain-containing protein [Saccharopolyspora indica]